MRPLTTWQSSSRVVTLARAIGALTFGSLDGYSHVSGLPMIGTLLVVVGALMAFGSMVCALLGLVSMGIDTGGSVWFLIATWKDASLWDRST